MSILDRVASLKTKHSELQNKISAEEMRPQPDEIAIYELKRQKLKLKDEINALSPRLH